LSSTSIMRFECCRHSPAMKFEKCLMRLLLDE
jgi:hypothetical protein